MPQIRQAVGSYQNISLDDVCSLITITYTKDDLKQQKAITRERQVFCMLSSVNRAEFFAAGKNGHKPQMILYMQADEYDNQEELKYRNDVYKIYRSFFRTDGYVELSCEKRVGRK